MSNHYHKLSRRASEMGTNRMGFTPVKGSSFEAARIEKDVNNNLCRAVSIINQQNTKDNTTFAYCCNKM